MTSEAVVVLGAALNVLLAMSVSVEIFASRRDKSLTLLPEPLQTGIAQSSKATKTLFQLKYHTRSSCKAVFGSPAVGSGLPLAGFGINKLNVSRDG